MLYTFYDIRWSSQKSKKEYRDHLVGQLTSDADDIKSDYDDDDGKPNENHDKEDSNESKPKGLP